jgi:hypothetical protein
MQRPRGHSQAFLNHSEAVGGATGARLNDILFDSVTSGNDDNVGGENSNFQAAVDASGGATWKKETHPQVGSANSNDATFAKKE